MAKNPVPTVRRRSPAVLQRGTLRYWLTRIEMTIEAMESGLITSAECSRRTTEYEKAMRTQTLLKTLKLQGFDDTPDEATLAREGEPVERPIVATTKTITSKTGNTPKGPIDELTESYEVTVVPGQEE